MRWSLCLLLDKICKRVKYRGFRFKPFDFESAAKGNTRDPLTILKSIEHFCCKPFERFVMETGRSNGNCQRIGSLWHHMSQMPEQTVHLPFRCKRQSLTPLSDFGNRRSKPFERFNAEPPVCARYKNECCLSSRSPDIQWGRRRERIKEILVQDHFYSWNIINHKLFFRIG